jgi:hypothetical protein
VGQKWKFVVWGVIAIGIMVVVLYLRPRQAASPPDLNYLAVVLLRESATDDRQHQSRFFTALTAVAVRHGVKLSEYIPDWYVSEGRAVLIKADHSDRVVVLLRGNMPVIPGEDTQYLLLLDQEGRQLDRVSCAINNRLTELRGDEGAILRTDVLRTPSEDAAQLVIRYIPEEGESIAGNWGHEIIHRGRIFRFGWDQDKPDSIRSAEWEKKGLCRIAVRESQLEVIFPRLSQSKGVS